MLYKLNKINFKAKKSSMVKQKKKINIFNFTKIKLFYSNLKLS